jgi:hypothetical protein
MSLAQLVIHCIIYVGSRNSNSAITLITKKKVSYTNFKKGKAITCEHIMIQKEQWYLYNQNSCQSRQLRQNKWNNKIIKN